MLNKYVQIQILILEMLSHCIIYLPGRTLRFRNKQYFRKNC